MADIKALGEQAVWLEEGRVKATGYADEVVALYLARMVEKDARRTNAASATGNGSLSSGVAMPQLVEGLPNVDARHGNEAAEIIGMAALDGEGEPASLIEAQQPLVLRVSVRANRQLPRPNVSVTMRNHIGLEFAVFDAKQGGLALPPMEPDDVRTVDFLLEVPELYPGNFSFSPCVTDGSPDRADVCDRVENALTLQMTHSGKPIYGYVQIPCQVVLNDRLTPDAEPTHTVS
jgi:hypothetical protein